MFKKILAWLVVTVIFIVVLRFALPFTFTAVHPFVTSLAERDGFYRLLGWDMTAETYGDMEALILLVVYAVPAAVMSWCALLLYSHRN